MHHHVLAPIETATDLVSDERAEVLAEREAFATLAKRVSECPTAPWPTDAPPPVVSRSETDPHERLRQAYRETVMGVDHYDDAYGESVYEHVAAELGADLATALRAELPFTDAFKTTLCDAVGTACDEREWLLDVLQRETESLRGAETELRDVVGAMQSLDRRETVPSAAELRRRCERIGERRQRVVHAQLQSAREADALYDYLYESQSWTHPVLTVVATLVEDLTVHRRSGVSVTE